MKKLFTLALLLASASILLISCSQLSNTSVTKSHYQDVIYVDPGGNEKSDLVNGATGNFAVKGYSTLQKDSEEAQDIQVEENTMMPDQQPVSTSGGSGKTEEPYKAVINNTPDIKGDNGNSSEIISEYRGNPDITQPVNYDGSGRSSNGVPFWLIVICAIIIPPLGVALMYGIVDKFWICLLLTFLFFLPGMIYALIQVLK